MSRLDGPGNTRLIGLALVLVIAGGYAIGQAWGWW